MVATPERIARGPVDSPNNPFGFLANSSQGGPAPKQTARKKPDRTASDRKYITEPKSEPSALGQPTLLFANSRAAPQNNRSRQTLQQSGAVSASSQRSSNAHEATSAHNKRHGIVPSGGNLKKQCKRSLSPNDPRGTASDPRVLKRTRIPEEDPLRNRLRDDTEPLEPNAAVGSRRSARNALATSGSGRTRKPNRTAVGRKGKTRTIQGAVPGDFTFAAEIEYAIRRGFDESTAPPSLRPAVHPDSCWIDALGRGSFSGMPLEFVLERVSDPLTAGYIAGTIHQSLRMHCARIALGRELTPKESEGLCQAVNRGVWCYAIKKFVPTAAGGDVNRHYHTVCKGIINAFAKLGKWQIDEVVPIVEKETTGPEQTDAATQTDTAADFAPAIREYLAVGSCWGGTVDGATNANVNPGEVLDDSEPISLAGSSDDEQIGEDDTLEARQHSGTARSRKASVGQHDPVAALEGSRSAHVDGVSKSSGTGTVDDGNVVRTDDTGHENDVNIDEHDDRDESDGEEDENYGEVADDGDLIDGRGIDEDEYDDEADKSSADQVGEQEGGGIDENVEEIEVNNSETSANVVVDGQMDESEGVADATVGIAGDVVIGDDCQDDELASDAVEELDETDETDKENIAEDEPAINTNIADPPQVDEGEPADEVSELDTEEYDEVEAEGKSLGEKEKSLEKNPQAEDESEDKLRDGEVPPSEFEIFEDDDGTVVEDSGLPDTGAARTPRLAGRKVLHPIEEADLRVRDAMQTGPRLDLSPSNPFVTPGTRQRFLTMMGR